MYVTVQEVYNQTRLSEDEVDSNSVKDFIKDAEGKVDKLTNTTYWIKMLNGTVDSATDDTLTDTGHFAGFDFEDYYAWIYSGTGSGQMRTIESHTDNVLTLERDWETNPDNTSKYRIIYSGTDPQKYQEKYDGDETDVLITNRNPIIILEAVEIDGTTVTPAYVYQYLPEGKLVLGTENCEASYWSSQKAQKNILTYWFGEYKIPQEVKTLCKLYASLKTLASQMGGTFDTPSTYRLPEGEVTVGQAYINIKGTFDVLLKEAKAAEADIGKYIVFG